MVVISDNRGDPEVGCLVSIRGLHGRFKVTKIKDDCVECFGPHPLFPGAGKKAPAMRTFLLERVSAVRMSAAQMAAVEEAKRR